MLDAKLLKENPSKIENMLKMRGVNFPLGDLVKLDKKRRELIIQLQELKHEKNILANSIARKKKEADTTISANDEISKMKDISNRITELELEQDQVLKKYRYLMMSIPNLLHESVPVGSTEKENVVIKERGNKTAKIAGARFYFLKNDLVKMNLALIQFGLDYLSNSGYTLVQPPYMIRKDAMEGAVILGDFEQVIYKVEDEDLYMIGTSEHAMVSMHMDEILDSPRLPLRYACVSPCFRKEAGAHGRDMKGIFRVHQFEKVEQVIFSRPEDSWKEHEKILELTEQFYERLGLPTRTILLCSADLGKISAKTYDIEAWFPGQSSYREIVSCSNCIDYQARRLRIRYRDNVNEETKLIHTLNSTLIATERTMVSIIENYQTDEGTVEVPEILRKYMGDAKEIKLYAK